MSCCGEHPSLRLFNQTRCWCIARRPANIEDIDVINECCDNVLNGFKFFASSLVGRGNSILESPTMHPWVRLSSNSKYSAFTVAVLRLVENIVHQLEAEAA